ARNLRAQLAYDPLHPRYTGELDLSPLKVNNLQAEIKLPVTIEKDRISFSNAQLATPKSKVVITGALEHLAYPRASGHVSATIALDEVKQVAALGIPLDTRHGPAVLKAEVNAATANNEIEITRAQVSLGSTSIQASGTTKRVQFESSLALDEIGRLLQLAQQPAGTVRLAGSGSYESSSSYRVNA